MKYLFTILLLMTFAVIGQAQGTPAPQAVEEMKVKAAQESQMVKGVISTRQGQETKVYTELIASTEKIVKGAPFSAEAVSESVQTLADGNRIVRNSSSKMYRDGEGRFRREGAVSSVGGMATFVSVSSTTITDPVAGIRYYLNDKDKTVRKAPFKFSMGFKFNPELGLTTTAAQKLHTELSGAYTVTAKQYTAAQAEMEKTLLGKTTIATATAAPSGEIAVITAAGGELRSTDATTESLGTRSFDGVEAEGTKTTNVIAAGKIGNERPIEIVYEKWYSKDLQMIVYSKHSDPRFGEQTYRLVNINRNEPDPAVFTVPSDYRIVAAEAGSPLIYKLTTTGVPAPASAPGAPAVVTVATPAKPTPAPKKAQ